MKRRMYASERRAREALASLMDKAYDKGWREAEADSYEDYDYGLRVNYREKVESMELGIEDALDALNWNDIQQARAILERMQAPSVPRYVDPKEVRTYWVKGKANGRDG